MPELPDITVYTECLADRIVGKELRETEIINPFVLRTVVPPVAMFSGRKTREVRRLGKRIVLGFDDEMFLVIHLMIAGRLLWRPAGVKVGSGRTMAVLRYNTGTILFRELSKKKRASIHLVQGNDQLSAFDFGGLEILEATLNQFRERLHNENHTLKRTLTDPRLFSGVGNAYSDEILHRARLSPIRQSQSLTSDEDEVLFHASRDTLQIWTDSLREEVKDGFPEHITAFRPEMAVHGRYRNPCPDCGAPVQRIVHAENEVNYCPGCQTDGKILADRSISRLLKKNWPRDLNELELRGLGLRREEILK